MRITGPAMGVPRFGTIVDVDESCQTVRTDDGKTYLLRTAEQVNGGKVGDRVKLLYCSG